MLIPLLPLALAIRKRHVSAAPDLVLVNHQALEADGATRVDLVGADADLGAEAVAHAVGEARGRVPVSSRAVDGRHEALGELLGRGQDGVGVVRAVLVDVGHGLLEAGDGLDGEGEGEELVAVVGILGVDEFGLVEGGGGGG